MEITLRKASAIQTAILEKINSIDIEHTTDLNEFQTVLKVLESKEINLLSAIETTANLWEHFYEIRTALGSANAASGVNAKLAELAKTEKLLQLYNNVTTKAYIQGDYAVLVGKVEKLKTAAPTERGYGYRDTVSTGVVSSKSNVRFCERINLLKKKKQKLNDEILELNVTTKITLSDDTVSVLTTMGIL